MDSQSPTLPTAAAHSATVLGALELSTKSWLVGLLAPAAARPSLHTLQPGDVAGLLALIERVRAPLARAGHTVTVITCYEAGRDGFWLHRQLTKAGLINHVLDAASLRVDRRARRAKTDRLDVHALLQALAAWRRGEDACSMVHVPSPAEEDAKRLHRERQRLIGERVAHVNRLKALAALQGIADFAPLKPDRRNRLAALRDADGAPLPAHLVAEMTRELARLELVLEQIVAIEAARDALMDENEGDGAVAKMQLLAQLKAIGPELATVLGREVFYRRFNNRRELAAYVGLDPSPYASGQSAREQGIAKAGNARARTAMIELAWLWLRYQPQSALSQWFHKRVGTGTGRVRRIAVVALARKLLVALWRYVETGLVPTDAQVKKA